MYCPLEFTVILVVFFKCVILNFLFIEFYFIYLVDVSVNSVCL